MRGRSRRALALIALHHEAYPMSFERFSLLFVTVLLGTFVLVTLVAQLFG